MKNRLRTLVAAFVVLGAAGFTLRYGHTIRLYKFDRPRYFLTQLGDTGSETKDTARQQKAIRSLEQLGPSAVPAMVQFVGKAAPTNAKQAVNEVLERVAPQSVLELAKLLEHRDVTIRQTATRLLSGVGANAERALPALRRAQKDEDRLVREEALGVILRIAADQSVVLAAIEDGRKDESWIVREKAIEAVLRVAADQPIARAAIEDGKKDPEPLLRIRSHLLAIELQDPENRSRTEPFYISLKGGQQVVPAMKQQEGNHLNVDDGMPILSELLRMNPSGYAASELVRRMGSPAIPALLALVDNSEPEPRRKALSAFVVLGHQAAPALPTLIRLLSDEDEESRKIAALVLHNIGSEAEAAVPALIEMLDDEDPSLRYHAAFALKGIGRAATSAIPHLIRVLKDGTHAAASAAFALGGIGPEAQDAVPDPIDRKR
jgi:HEAT repeat protein